MKFSEMNLDADLLRAIDEAGFTECLPVQEATFKRTLEGGDVTVQSQTGSGKTAAFLITIYHQLKTNEKFRGKKALVIVPTRELATQIEDDALKIGKYMPFRIASFFGGIGYAKQEAQLREGVDIMIGTPGRLIDFSRQKKINLQDVGILIIDEADRLFDMGFLPDLRKLLRKMPPAEERLTMLLSATLGLRVSSLAWEYMNGAEEIQIDPEQVTVETITQCIYHVSTSEKLRLLLGIMRREQPKNAIIFTNTKHAAEEISKRLNLNGYKSQFLMGDLPQKKRLRIIDDMKEGVISFLVATDVAARGLHVEDLDLVVNYDVPEDAENYVHRIGRTARVGKRGKAITLACEKFVFGLEAIENFIGIKIPVETFTDTELGEDKSAGMKIHTERYGRREERDEGRFGRGRGREEVRRAPRRDEFRREEPRRHREAGAPAPIAAGEDKRRPLGTGAPRNRGLDRPDPKKERQINPAKKGTGQKMTQEERLVFYKEKYGENFEPDRVGRGRHGSRKRQEFGGKPAPSRPSPAQPARAAQTIRPAIPAQPAPAAKPDESRPSLIRSILGFFKKKDS